MCIKVCFIELDVSTAMKPTNVEKAKKTTIKYMCNIKSYS